MVARGLDVRDDLNLIGVTGPVIRDGRAGIWVGDGGETGTLSEVGYRGSDGGTIIEYQAVIDIVCGSIEAFVCAPFQEGVLVYRPSCVEDWREEIVDGRGVVWG